MQLRGIEFGSTFSTTRAPRFLGLSTVLVSKPTTLTPRTGTHRRRIELGAGMIVATTDFANDGLQALLERAVKQADTQPFWITVVSLAGSRALRLEEYRAMAVLLQQYRPAIKASFGVQFYFSNQYIDGDQEDFVSEIREVFGVFAGLQVPLIPCLSVGIAPALAAEIVSDSNCDAIAVSLPIPWTDLPDEARKVFFRTITSPFAPSGGGVVSGKYLLPLVVEWIHQFRRLSRGKPILANGGVLRPRDVVELVETGAAAIGIGDALVLRPWNVSRISKRAQKLLEPKV